MSTNHRARSTLLCLLLWGGAGDDAAWAQQPRGAGRGELVAQLDSIMRAAMEERPIVGATVFVALGGDTLLSRGYGYADLEHRIPATPATVYRWMGKAPFAAVATLRVMEQGRLGLDDPVRRHLPELTSLDDRITIRQLLHSTSGLVDFHYLGDPYLALRQRLSAPDEVTALFADRPPLHEPGTRADWSFSGFHLLTQIVERVAGESYEEFVRRELLARGRLTSTTVCDESTVVPGVARRYRRTLAGFRNVVELPTLTLDRFCSTASDIGGFFRGLHTGRLLSADTWRQLVAVNPTARTRADSLRYRGLGLVVNRTGGAWFLEEGGMDDRGSFAAYEYPDDSLSVVVLTNTARNDARSLAAQLARVVLRLPLRPTNPPPAAPPLKDLATDAATRARYAGVYRLRLANHQPAVQPASDTLGVWTYRIFDQNGRLMIQSVDIAPQRLLVQAPDTLAFSASSRTRLVFAGSRNGEAAVLTRIDDVTSPGSRRYSGPRVGDASAATWLRHTFMAGLLDHAPRAPGSSSLALTHLNVVDVEGGRVLRDRTVLIEGSRIRAVAPSGQLRPGAGTRVVDASGSYLIPGLWDMHAHPTWQGQAPRHLPTMLAHGITGVRDMASPLDSALHWRARVRSGAVPGPRLVVAGPLLDGARPAWPHFSLAVSDSAAAAAAVDSLAAAGVDLVKPYNFLTRSAYFSMLRQAGRRGLHVAGHVPYAVGAAEASDAGQRGIEHLNAIPQGCSAGEPELRRTLAAAGDSLTGVDRVLYARVRSAARALRRPDAAACAALYARLARNGTWQTPTLVWWRAIAPAAFAAAAGVADARQTLPAGDPRAAATAADREHLHAVAAWTRAQLRPLASAGVGLLAGTDAPTGGAVPPGPSLHDELALLVQAGLTPLEALRAATLNPARYLGATDSLGTIAPGRLADLVLLDANPLEEIGNTRRIRAVVLNGRLLDRRQLDQLLAEPGIPAGGTAHAPAPQDSVPAPRRAWHQVHVPPPWAQPAAGRLTPQRKRSRRPRYRASSLRKRAALL